MADEVSRARRDEHVRPRPVQLRHPHLERDARSGRAHAHAFLVARTAVARVALEVRFATVQRRAVAVRARGGAIAARIGFAARPGATEVLGARASLARLLCGPAHVEATATQRDERKREREQQQASAQGHGCSPTNAPPWDGTMTRNSGASPASGTETQYRPNSGWDSVRTTVFPSWLNVSSQSP